MKVGFTGTRFGMTEPQKAVLTVGLFGMGIVTELHHGDCVGADEDAHKIALDMGILIVVHPPEEPLHRAFCKNAKEVLEQKPYLIRNQDIVDQTDLLIATPFFEYEEVRGGTWFTVRYARLRKKRIVIAWPSGKFELEGD